jgi:hypothetical protein
VRFLLGCIKQRLLAPAVYQKLESKLREIARKDAVSAVGLEGLAAGQAALEDVRGHLKTVSRNMALADTPEQMRAMQEVFEELRTREKHLELQIQKQGRGQMVPHQEESEVACALRLLKRLRDLSGRPTNYSSMKDLFAGVNARMFLRFREETEKKRRLNKLAGGVVTFGAAPPPVAIYSGPTGRPKVKGPAAPDGTAGPDSQVPPPNSKSNNPGSEGRSLGNMCRGDWIRTSDLLNPINGIEAGSNRRISQVQAF